MHVQRRQRLVRRGQLGRQVVPDFVGAGEAGEDGLSDDAIEALIAERDQARENKDFARADEIRDELAKNGVLLEDGAGGTTWKRG